MRRPRIQQRLPSSCPEPPVGTDSKLLREGAGERDFVGAEIDASGPLSAGPRSRLLRGRFIRLGSRPPIVLTPGRRRQRKAENVFDFAEQQHDGVRVPLVEILLQQPVDTEPSGAQDPSSKSVMACDADMCKREQRHRSVDDRIPTPSWERTTTWTQTRCAQTHSTPRRSRLV